MLVLSHLTNYKHTCVVLFLLNNITHFPCFFKSIIYWNNAEQKYQKYIWRYHHDIYKQFFIRILKHFKTINLAQSAGAVEYTNCTSARGKTPSPTSVLDMTLNNLMVRFQWCWDFGKCRAPLHCHCSQVHSGLKW